MDASDLTAGSGITQGDLVHQLPPAKVVDRIGYLTGAVRGRRAVHVGFVDRGCWAYHEQFDSWLHAHLDRAASALVGLDLDEAGVEEARAHGDEAHAVDCSDDAAVGALGLEPAEVVIAGEIIEHLDDSGSFLDGLHALCRPDGRLVVTTPNSSGLLFAAAAVGGYEVNHPDHITLYSCFTLTNLLARHGWEVTEVATYVAVLKEFENLHGRMKLLGFGAKAVLGVEKLLGRLGRPYAADGLIVSARPQRPDRRLRSRAQSGSGHADARIAGGGRPSTVAASSSWAARSRASSSARVRVRSSRRDSSHENCTTTRNRKATEKARKVAGG